MDRHKSESLGYSIFLRWGIGVEHHIYTTGVIQKYGDIGWGGICKDSRNRRTEQCYHSLLQRGVLTVKINLALLLFLIFLLGCVTRPQPKVKMVSALSRQSTIQVFPFAGITRVPQDVHVAWSPPVDFSPAGFNVYYGVDPDLESSTMIPVGTTTNTVVTSLAGGTQYYFAVTDFDGFGDESDLSQIVPYTTPLKLDITFTFNGAATNVVIQQSTNLNNWSTFDATATNGVYRINAPQDIPVVFYRAMAQSTDVP